MDAKDYAAAIDTFNAALTYDPENDEIIEERDECIRRLKAMELIKQAQVKEKGSDFAGAVDLLLEALKLDPHNRAIAEEEARDAKLAKAAALKKKGIKLLGEKDNDGAVTAFATALGLNPEDPELPVLLKEAQDKAEARRLQLQGEHEAEARDYAAAVETFNAALEFDCDNDEIIAERDDALRKLQDAEAAAKAAEEAAKKRALAAQAEEERRKAEEERAAAEAARLAAEAKKAKKAKEAKKAKAKELKEEADEMMEDGDYYDAARTYAIAASLDPEDAELPELQKNAAAMAKAFELKQVAEHEVDAKAYAKAVATFDEALTVLDEADCKGALYVEIIKERDAARRMVQAEALKAEGLALYDRGDLRGAMAKFYEALGYNPNDKELASKRAEIEKKQKALQLLDEAKALEQQWKFSDAAKLLTVAIGLDPTNRQVSDLLKENQTLAEVLAVRKQADAEFAAGDFGMARITYGKALESKFRTIVTLNKDEKGREFWAGLQADLSAAEQEHQRVLAEQKARDAAAEAKRARRAKAYELKKEADEMMEDGDYADAARTFLVAKGLDPEDETFDDLIDEAKRLAEALNLVERGVHECDLKDYEKGFQTFEEGMALQEAHIEHCDKFGLPIEVDVFVKLSTYRTTAHNMKFALAEFEVGQRFFAEGDFEAAKAAFECGKKFILDDENLGAVQFRATFDSWIARCIGEEGKREEKRKKAVVLIKEGVVYFEKEELTLAVEKFEEATAIDPDSEDGADWLKKARQRLKATVETKVEVIEIVENEEITAEKERVIKVACQKTAEKAFTDLDLSAAGTLNYMKFINWFKKQMKLGGKRSRISDHTLQTTMQIWKQFDTDGQGVKCDKLGSVMTGMMKAGVVRIATDGTVVDCN